MRLIQINKKKKKAATLAEVMIVLGIISTAMVASISVMINSLIRIKINDIEDSANTVMVKALEVAKSPAAISVSENIDNRTVNVPIYFLLNTSSQLQLQNNDSINTTCTDNNKYNVKALLPEDITASSQICVQIEIIPRYGLENARLYEIIVRSYYTLPNGDLRANVIKGYRYKNI